MHMQCAWAYISMPLCPHCVCVCIHMYGVYCLVVACVYVCVLYTCMHVLCACMQQQFLMFDMMTLPVYYQLAIHHCILVCIA